MPGREEHDFSAPTFPGPSYIPALFGTAVYFYGGLVFIKAGLRELSDRRPGMTTLISLEIAVAFVFSPFTMTTSDIVRLLIATLGGAAVGFEHSRRSWIQWLAEKSTFFVGRLL